MENDAERSTDWISTTLQPGMCYTIVTTVMVNFLIPFKVAEWSNWVATDHTYFLLEISAEKAASFSRDTLLENWKLYFHCTKNEVFH